MERRIKSIGVLSILTLLILGEPLHSSAQISGNQVFQNGGGRMQYQGYHSNNVHRHDQSSHMEEVKLSDSTFRVRAKVMKYVEPDHYIAVFGLRDMDETVKGSSKKLRERVEAFKEGLNDVGIRKKDIYTDMVAHYRVYDVKFESEENHQVAEEYLKGFEIGKNMIVRYEEPEQVESMLKVASSSKIFDLIKVDHVIEDRGEVYDELFEKSSDVLKRKRERYLGLSGAEISPNVRILKENFTSYQPGELYKNYQAHSTNYYETYVRDWQDKKAARKFTTFYYEPPEHAGFDKVVGEPPLEPRPVFILELDVAYELVQG